jgi:hypothetical protein
VLHNSRLAIANLISAFDLTLERRRQYSDRNPRAKGITKGFAESPSELAKSLIEAYEGWKGDPTCSCLRTAVRQIPSPERINKIVAFGLGYIDDVYVPTRMSTISSVRRMRSQHLTMMTIRETLQEMIVESGKEPQRVELFLHDPANTDFHKEAWKVLDIHVTNADYRYHDGFLKVDRSTIVVEIACTVPVVQLACEMTEPAAFVSTHDILHVEPEIPHYSWVFQNDEFNSGDEIVIPAWNR